MPAISIIIPTRQRAAIFMQTLEAAVKAISAIDAEIIIVNDCKTEDISYFHPKVRIYKNRGRGVSVARNYGAELANSPLLLFIDNDILISSENITRTLAIHAGKDHIIVNANWEYPPELRAGFSKNQFARVICFWKQDSFKNRYTSFNGPWQAEPFAALWPFAGFYFSVSKKDFIEFARFNEENVFGGEEEEVSKKIAGKLEYWIDPLNIVYHNETDKLSGYREWLKRIDINKADREAFVKNGLKGFLLRTASLLVPFNYFILDHFPNKPAFDKMYARLLYFQSLILKNKQQR